MKYNRREIMKAAWSLYRRASALTFAEALHRAWAHAKMAMMRYDVIGYDIYCDRETVIARNVDADTAAQIEYRNRWRYDSVSMRLAA